MMFIRTNEQYGDGVKLDEYKGVFSLLSAKDKGGEVYPQWCKAKTSKDTYASKDMPLGVRLGDKTQAIQILEGFASALRSGAAEPEPDPTIPF